VHVAATGPQHGFFDLTLGIAQSGNSEFRSLSVEVWEISKLTKVEVQAFTDEVFMMALYEDEMACKAGC
jgi:hypothetical protein